LPEPAKAACRSEISLGRDGGPQLDGFVVSEESCIAQGFVDVGGFDIRIGVQDRFPGFRRQPSAQASAPRETEAREYKACRCRQQDRW